MHTHRALHPYATVVTGGSGLIGGEVIVALARAGRRVRALIRAESAEHARHRLMERLRKSADYRSGYADLIEAVPGDSVKDAFGCGREVADGVESIVHCAANTSFSERERDSIWKTNAGGAKNLVAFARQCPPGVRLMLVSTASVVTAPTGTCLTEEQPFGGHENAYTVSKREAERIVTGSGLDAVIVRPTIVLSRGVDDRAMARSILWSIPIMNEIGEVPVDPDAFVDVVPVDFVAEAIARLAMSDWLKYRLYHISAGRDSHTFSEVLGEIVRYNPQYNRIRLTGSDGPRPRNARRLFAPIDAYLPFINGSVQYSNDRLQQELGSAGRVGTSIGYIHELLNLIELDEALTEMAKP